MKSRWTLPLAGLFVLALVPGVTAEDVAALPDETPVEEDAGAPAYTLTGDTDGGGGAGDEGTGESSSCLDRIRVRAHVLYEAYKDLEISRRSVSRNDLSLSFSQPTVSKQNDAEQKSWWATTEMVELHVDLLGEGPQTVWLYAGAGARQSDQDFGTASVEIDGPAVGVYAVGALGNLGEVASGVSLDWEARFTYAKSQESPIDEIPNVDEELETRITTYSARLVAVFDPALLGPCSNLGGVLLQPYAGVLYHHLDGKETYTAASSSGVVGESKFTFNIRSRGTSDVRALGGLRLLGLEEHGIVDLEGSIGHGSYGAGLVLHIRF